MGKTLLSSIGQLGQGSVDRFVQNMTWDAVSIDSDRFVAEKGTAYYAGAVITDGLMFLGSIITIAGVDGSAVAVSIGSGGTLTIPAGAIAGSVTVGAGGVGVKSGANLSKDVRSLIDKFSNSGGSNLPSVVIDKSKLQKKWKHAPDFGVSGNYNKENANAFKEAIENHVNTADAVYKSKYRNPTDIYVYLKGDVAVYTDLNGNFVSGWRLNQTQVNYHLTNGTKIK